jgi:ribonuclease P protein component
MISFDNRFHGHKSLGYVYKNGQAVRSRLMTIKFVTNKYRTQSRIAVVVGKKISKSAVRRNRIRRRIYEYIRLELPNFDGVYDIAVIVLSNELLNITHNELLKQLDQLFIQTNIKK